MNRLTLLLVLLVFLFPSSELEAQTDWVWAYYQSYNVQQSEFVSNTTYIMYAEENKIEMR
jgi:hypothetical protein